MKRSGWGSGWVVSGELVVAAPSWAGLGGGVDSVADDAVAMKGQVERRATSAVYSVHEITTAFHTKVREYVSASGVVFGVAWEGPLAPDFQQLMGSHFQHLSSALAARKSGRAGRRPLSVTDGDLVFENRGHAMAHFGRAFIPSLVPAGISSEVVQ